MSLTIERTSKRSIGPTIGILCGLGIAVAGCSGPQADLFAGNERFSTKSMGVSASPRVTTSRNVPKGGGRYQVGQPYKVAGQWFEPREQRDLDVVGQASWYGPAFHGRLTANGEVFDQYHLSGAHPTLPLPDPRPIGVIESTSHRNRPPCANQRSGRDWDRSPTR